MPRPLPPRPGGRGVEHLAGGSEAVPEVGRAGRERSVGGAVDGQGGEAGQRGGQLGGGALSDGEGGFCPVVIHGVALRAGRAASEQERGERAAGEVARAGTPAAVRPDETSSAPVTNPASGMEA